ncbi:MAG TPA: hypothetical protein VGK74_19275 [Symbiobacteriaceae bacterium]
MGTTVIKPGKSVSFDFPYHMGPGMGGKHRFQVIIKTNDTSLPNSAMVFEVYANSTERK